MAHAHAPTPPVVVFGPLLLLACAEPPDISGDIETHADLLSDVNSLLCGCAQLLGYADSSQCTFTTIVPPITTVRWPHAR
jgi:hypothetical protein